MNDILPAIGALVTAVIGLAIVAVLVSKSAQTSTVIGAASSGLATIIGQAVSPVTGSGTTNSFGSMLNVPNYSNSMSATGTG